MWYALILNIYAVILYVSINLAALDIFQARQNRLFLSNDIRTSCLAVT